MGFHIIIISNICTVVTNSISIAIMSLHPVRFDPTTIGSRVLANVKVAAYVEASLSCVVCTHCVILMHFVLPAVGCVM